MFLGTQRQSDTEAEAQTGLDAGRLGGVFRLWRPWALYFLYAASAVLSVLIVWQVLSSPARTGDEASSPALFAFLAVNFVIEAVLVTALVVRILNLTRGRLGSAGARLHLRFATLFAAAAVAPAVIVALFFGLLVSRGVETWFSKRVQSSVENGAEIGRTYVKEQYDAADQSLRALAADLDSDQLRILFPTRLAFSRELEAVAGIRGGLTAVYVLDGQGRIQARAETPDAPPYQAPPLAFLSRPGQHQVREESITQHPDAVRVVMSFPGYPGSNLYGVRLIKDGMVLQLRAAERAIVDYREAARNRGQVQLAFGLSYAEMALLLIIGAVWLGLTAAETIAGPVARLVHAAGLVASGDLNARVETTKGSEEISVLSRAFNRMTGDLQSQQQALQEAHGDAERRRRFMETVLSGVSAGVIGIDAKGAISAINDQALRLLKLSAEVAVGESLAGAAPELAEMAATFDSEGVREAEMDIVRAGETVRLRVRAVKLREGGGVLTFDDITRLVNAQRNAAWRDVARRIAHEIKNPLTPIQLSAERLRKKYRSQIQGDIDTFDRCTDTIVRQVGDIGRMVDEFSSFARMPAPVFGVEDAREMLRRAVFAQKVAAPETPIETFEPEFAVDFVCDLRMVGQALTNILKNAGEAVSARRLQDPTAILKMRTELVLSGEGLTFVVEDDGVGLPDADRHRLTEPYVTTRKTGTGLGLAIVKRIMEEHGGELILTDAQTLSGARAELRFSTGYKSRRAAETETQGVGA